MNKINVIGTSASGKSTVAKQLAAILSMTYIELDNLFWLDDWQESSDKDLLDKIQKSMDENELGYIIDGNYSRTKLHILQNIDTVIWIDLPFYVTLWQSIQRAFSRAMTKKKLWNNSNNVESFSRIFTQQSIILWMLKTYKKNKTKYALWRLECENLEVNFIHLKSRQEVQEFLEKIEKSTSYL